MNRLFPVVLISLLSALAFNPSAAAEASWNENFVSAQAKAESEGKPMLLLFTGSDWCGYCIKLEKGVLSSEEFAQYTESSYVLVKADFPRGIPQSEALVKQNEELAAEYGVQGFPTVLVVSPDGKTVLDRKVGYAGTTPADYIEDLRKYEAKS